MPVPGRLTPWPETSPGVAKLYDEPSEADRYQMIRTYFQMLIEEELPDAVGKMKQFASWFTHGVPGGAGLRKAIYESKKRQKFWRGWKNSSRPGCVARASSPADTGFPRFVCMANPKRNPGISLIKNVLFRVAFAGIILLELFICGLSLSGLAQILPENNKFVGYVLINLLLI